MGTKADAIGVAARPVRFTLWAAAVSALAATALILSAVALTVAARDQAVTGAAVGGIRGEAIAEVPTWDAAKLEAMEGRLLAESVLSDQSVQTWDADKLAALEARMLAESLRNDG